MTSKKILMRFVMLATFCVNALTPLTSTAQDAKSEQPEPSSNNAVTKSDQILARFTAKPDHNNVYIQCRTKGAIEEGLLVLERSTGNLEFVAIQMRPCFNSPIELAYSFQDLSVRGDMVWYRVRYVRHGETPIFSESIPVKVANTEVALSE
ncbi:MAG: hypothetical protein KDD36_05115 [Flavobacteriales bacterium]|nr:hypothetical protein [Flavobacteriales bacterium]